MPCRNDYPDNADGPCLDVLLCEAMDIIEQAGLVKKMSPELSAWFAKHEAAEVERVKAEALAKLTPKEKRALGLAPKRRK